MRAKGRLKANIFDFLNVFLSRSTIFENSAMGPVLKLRTSASQYKMFQNVSSVIFYLQF
jgi:hypothetical protein